MKPLQTSPVTPLPERLHVGRGSALFIDGCCFHPEARIVDLAVAVDGAEHRVLGTASPPQGRGADGTYWWSIVPCVPVSEPRLAKVVLRARLAGGMHASSELGAIELRPELERSRNASVVSKRPLGTADSGARAGGERPLIAICMTSYEPPLDLFERQITSIRAQTYDNWICVISDDRSSPDRLAAMGEILASDERFVLAPASERLGFYRNFERALTLAPPEAVYIALSDHDDRWYPDKLETLQSRLAPGARLVYSDMRIVDREGRVRSDTYWNYRRNNYTNFGSLLLANTITGAASLFARDLLDYVLPFPPRQGDAYHDHWIALVAMALGPVTYIDRPLYDYVQHDAAALGHARANKAVRHNRQAIPASRPHASQSQPLRVRLSLRWLWRRFGARWRNLYFSHYCRIAITARVVEMRCGDLMAQDKLRTLRRFRDSVGAIAWLAARSLRPLLRRNETLGRERLVLGALAWRRLVERRGRMQVLRRLRAGPPADRRPPKRGPRTPPASMEAEWRGPAGRERSLVPILVDYFARDGSTLMMKLLASSPHVAVEQVYPFERKYFAYLWRWSRMLQRGEWRFDGWGPTALGSISQEPEAPLLGPPPWNPRSLIEAPTEEETMSRRCFDLCWQEFSRRAARWTRAEHPAHDADVRYYAEKHLNTWLLDQEELPPVKLIALLRDPRDTYVSIGAFSRAMRTDNFGRDQAVSDREHLDHIIDRQRERLRWIAALLEEGVVPVIRYEDLVLDLPAVARRLEDWLDIRIDPGAALGDKRMRTLHVTASSPDESIGRWKHELDAEVAELFGRKLRREMEAVGLEV